jgi:hypothetical protein
MRGQMLWFNETKDQGFIMTDEGERLPVGGEGFAGGERPVGRCARKVVTFEIEGYGAARQANNVVFESGAVAYRPRIGAGRGARR